MNSSKENNSISNVSLDLEFCKGVIECSKRCQQALVQVLYFEEIPRKDKDKPMRYNVALSDGFCYFRAAFCHEAAKKIQDGLLAKYDIIYVIRYIVSQLTNQGSTLVMVTDYERNLSGIKKIIGKPVYITDYSSAKCQNPFGNNQAKYDDLFQGPKRIDITNDLYSQFMKEVPLEIKAIVNTDASKNIPSQSDQNSTKKKVKTKNPPVVKSNTLNEKRHSFQDITLEKNLEAEFAKEAEVWKPDENLRKDRFVSSVRRGDTRPSFNREQTPQTSNKETKKKDGPFSTLHENRSISVSRFSLGDPIDSPKFALESSPILWSKNKESNKESQIQHEKPVEERIEVIQEKEQGVSQNNERVEQSPTHKVPVIIIERPKEEILIKEDKPEISTYDSEERIGSQNIEIAVVLEVVDMDDLDEDRSPQREVEKKKSQASQKVSKEKKIKGESDKKIVIVQSSSSQRRTKSVEKNVNITPKSTWKRLEEEEKTLLKQQQKFFEYIQEKQQEPLTEHRNTKIQLVNKDKNQETSTSKQLFRSSSHQNIFEERPRDENSNREPNSTSSSRQLPFKLSIGGPVLVHKNPDKSLMLPPKDSTQSSAIITQHKELSIIHSESPNLEQITMPIRDLTYVSNDWTIKARVVHKSFLKEFQTKNGRRTKLFSIDLIDKDQGQIEAIFFGNLCNEYYNRLKEKFIYYFSGGVIKRSALQHSSSKNDLQIVFEGNADIKDAKEDGSIPMEVFRFRNISEIQALGFDDLVDIVGIIYQTGPICDVSIRNGEVILKRSILIYDTTYKIIEITLWGSACKTNFERDTLIIFKNLKVSQYLGKKMLVSIARTAVFTKDFPMDLQEVKDVNKMLQRKSIRQQVERKNYQRSLIGTLIEQQVFFDTSEKHFFDINASIIHIQSDALSTFYYLSCPRENCLKKIVDNGDGNWKCLNCQGIVKYPKARYTLFMLISDFSGSLWVTAFDTIGEIILGCPASHLRHLRESEKEEDMLEFSRIVKRPTLKEFNMRIMLRHDEFKGKKEWRYSIIKISPLHYVEEAKKTLQLLNFLDGES